MKIQFVVINGFILLFLTLSLLFVYRTNNVTDLEGAWIIEPKKQEAKERKWLKVEFEKIAVSNDYLDSDLMLFDVNDYLYVNDNTHLKVKIFDTSASQVAVLGKGRGSGPGEFNSISNLRIDTCGKIWILDPSNNRATIFHLDNPSEWDILEFPVVPLNIIPLNKQHYLLETRFKGNLDKYNFSGELIKQFDVLVDDPPLWSGVLVSYYDLAINGNIIAAQYDTNNLVKYSKEGSILYFRRPIEPPTLPKINPYYANDVGRVNSVDYTTWMQTTNRVEITENIFHVFIRDNFEWFWEEQRIESRRKIVDVYDLEMGDYLYSYKLPENLSVAAVSKTHLAGIPEELGKLVIWEVQGGWPEIKKGGNYD